MNVTADSATSQPATLINDIERATADLWQQVLNTPSLPGPTDNFFFLGGDSIAMIMVELRIKEEFSIDLPEGALLSTSSLRDLAQLIEACIPPERASHSRAQ